MTSLTNADLKARPEATWSPILDQEQTARADVALTAIAADLKALIQGDGPINTTLGNGLVGPALFFAYLDLARPGEGHGETAVLATERLLESLPDGGMGCALYDQSLGVAWLLEHLRGWLLASDSSTEEVLEELVWFVEHWPENADYDLISGLVGIGVVASEASRHADSRATADRLFAAVSEQLRCRSSTTAEGAVWWTAPSLLPEHQREVAAEGYYNLGVAHGVAGALGLMGAWPGTLTGATEDLMRAGVRALLATPHGGAVSRFGSWATDDSVSPARLAWCYGDPGVAIALLQVADRGGPKALEWRELAIEVVRHALVEPAGRRGIRDAGLCHGSAGMGHLCNRLFQHTGDDFFYQQATDLFALAIRQRREGEGVGGYLAWSPSTGNDFHWLPDPGFLIGAAGVGLALLGASTGFEPAWDRLLLTSLRVA